MLAVIKTGGKQYLVKKGDKIRVEKLEGKEGDKVVFTEVLLLQKDKKIEIGTPLIKSIEIVGKILKQGKSKKVIIFKYKSKKRYKKKAGHRQPYTEVEIEDIKKIAPVRKARTKKEEKKKK